MLGKSLGSKNREHSGRALTALAVLNDKYYLAPFRLNAEKEKDNYFIPFPEIYNRLRLILKPGLIVSGTGMGDVFPPSKRYIFPVRGRYANMGKSRPARLDASMFSIFI
ncbi:MAG: hypothetical protein LRY51_16585 [Geovibrio sp.]|nr:hypothetical protein [Geovibrio sp.]